MSSKPSDLLHFYEGDEGPSHTPFVNLDAEWLWELSESFRGEPEEVRLRTIAGRLERLDEQVRNLTLNKNTEELSAIVEELAKDQFNEIVAWNHEGGVEIAKEAETMPDLREEAQELVDRIAKIVTGPAFTAGIIEGKRRYLERSNLPVQSSELSPDLRAAIAATTVQPRRITAVPKPKAEAKPTALALAGIKLRFTKED